MIICPNCGKQLADGSRFCTGCGSPISQAAPAGGRAPANGGAPMGGGAPANGGAPTSGGAPAGSGAPIGGGVPTGGGVPMGGGAPMGGETAQTKKKFPIPKKYLILGITGAAAILLILLICILVVACSGSSMRYALYEKNDDIYFSRKAPGEAVKIIDDADGFSASFSKDGKLMFYFHEGDLYFRKVSDKKGEGTRIAKGVSRYAVNESGSIVTYEKNDGLYQYIMSKEDDYKVTNDVGSWYVSENGKKLIYEAREDDKTVLYRRDSGENEQEVKMETDVSLAYVTRDLETVYYTDDGDLYKMSVGKDGQKIDSHVTGTVIYDSGEIYYAAERDNEYSLYYYDGTEATVLESGIGKDETGENFDILGMSPSPSAANPALAYKKGDSLYIVSGNTISEISQSDVPYIRFSGDGKTAFFLADYEDDEGDLYKVTLSKNKVGTAEKYDSDVSVVYPVGETGNTVVYFKDYKNGEGEMYMNQEKIDSDVSMRDISYNKKTEKLLYFTDYSDGEGDLNYTTGGKGKKIDSDVASAIFLPDGYILYLKDYEDDEGDLYGSSGGKGKKIDEDVSEIVRIYAWEDMPGGYN